MRTTALATFGIIFGGIALIVLMFFMTIVGKYNGLQTSRTAIDTARADVDTQLQRRFDLVPSLVSSVRGSMKQEQKVFGDIAKARTQYATTEKGSTERVQAANGYESAISRLLVVMENYPVLQSNDRVGDLMVQLEGSENRISVARQRYNEVVRPHNTKIRTFPTNMLAGFFGITEELMFDAVVGAEVAPTVDFEDITE